MSDEISFSLNKNQLISMAFGLLNVYTGYVPIPASDSIYAGQMLNCMIKYWQYVNKAQIITRRTGYVFPQLNQISYNLTPTSGDHATYAYVQTATTVNNHIGDTTLTVASVSGISIGDHVGVQGATSGMLLWSTVSNINGLVLTIADALTDTTTAGATVFDYTTPMNRPIMIHRAWRTDTTSALDVPLHMLSSSDYGDISLKTRSGIITAYWYEPQESTGILHLWQSPQNVTDIVTLSFTHEVDDYDLATDTSDFNSAWYLPIAYGLATYLAPRYGKHQEAQQTLTPVAQQLFKAMCGADSERGTAHIVRY